MFFSMNLFQLEESSSYGIHNTSPPPLLSLFFFLSFSLSLSYTRVYPLVVSFCLSRLLSASSEHDQLSLKVQRPVLRFKCYLHVRQESLHHWRQITCCVHLFKCQDLDICTAMLMWVPFMLDSFSIFSSVLLSLHSILESPLQPRPLEIY